MPTTTKRKQKPLGKTALGLDLSLTATGVVVVEDKVVKKQELIRSKPSGNSHVSEIERLLRLVDSVMAIVKESGAGVVAIEGLAFMARNTTALVQLSALNYMVRRELYLNNIPFVIIAPPSLKKFVTGHGNAQKDVMMLETYKKYGESFLDNNLCDGYGLARCGAAIAGYEWEELTIPQREAIKGAAEQFSSYSLSK